MLISNRHRLILAVLTVALPAKARAQDLPIVTASAGACASLKTLRLPDVRFTEIADVTDSVQRGDNVRGTHCRVTGVTGKAIQFVVVLPNRWNQRLLMGGNGGFAGTLNRGILTYSSNGGYVTVTTNTGHEAPPGGGASWALNDPERQLDFGYVAVHRSLEIAKTLAHMFYGSDPRFSYFTGCSNGGRQAMMEVERYPEDFDGVVAGAPAAQWAQIGASMVKDLKALFPDPSYFDKPIVTQDNLDLLAGAVLEACDALDGVKDGVLDDPRDCRFKLSSLKACPRDKPARDCLTKAQRSAIGVVYSPTVEDGREAYPGQVFGGENLPAGWPGWLTGRDSALMRQLHVPNLYAMFATEGGKYFAFNDSTWDYSKSKGTFLKDGSRMRPVVNADNPDIGGFARKKGKLILFHGWADPALNPLATIDLYNRILKRDSAAREYVRLFMLPGILHCAGGPGVRPTDAELLRAIVDWVEKSQSPERFVGVRRDSTQKVTRSRPLCAYPARAVYSGTGSTDEAASFVCREK